MSNSFGIANESALTFKVARQPRKGISSFSEGRGLMMKQWQLDCEVFCVVFQKKQKKLRQLAKQLRCLGNRGRLEQC